MGMGSSLCLFLMLLLAPLSLLLSLNTLAYSFSPPLQPISCHAHDTSALLQFKESFVIDKLASSDPLAHPKLRSWSLHAHADCCSWDGVYCDQYGHVIALDLSSSCLFGSINSNSSLFRLNHLQWLSLADNNFNFSPIPPQLALFSNTLTHLNLSVSNFAGQVPSQISSLSKLTVLDLHPNVYSDSDSLLHLKNTTFGDLVQNMSSLQVLILSGVNISSSVPKAISNLSSLSRLYLRGCNLVGEFPSDVFLLPNLEYLTIRFNQQLTGHLPPLKRSPLKLIYLKSTSFYGALPESIQNLHSLTSFDITNCNFSGPIPSSFGNLPQLTNLDFTYNPYLIVGDLTWLARLTNLQFLSFKGINIMTEIPDSLATLTNLNYLDLSKCQLVGHIPFWLQNLTQLRVLSLNYNSLQGPFPKSIFSKLVNLEELGLWSNNLSGSLGMAMFSDMRNLTNLDLGLNQLYVADYNGSLPNFNKLLLQSCNLDKFPNFLKNQQELGWLSLAGNNIHGEVPNWFCNVSKPTLYLLELSYNFLTGFNAQCNAGLPWFNLEYLDVSNNMMRGPIPIPPPSINFYNVQVNMLSGEIPSLLCNMELLSLHLSHNNLSGEIPHCLGNVPSLHELGLNNNSFSGAIPEMCTNGTALLFMID